MNEWPRKFVTKRNGIWTKSVSQVCRSQSLLVQAEALYFLLRSLVSFLLDMEPRLVDVSTARTSHIRFESIFYL